ncbi:MAG: nuclear transport factor 2 family protein [Prevotella sp.]|nr:nuclear transport factor 2 family protein [Prevotella sp.]
MTKKFLQVVFLFMCLMSVGISRVFAVSVTLTVDEGQNRTSGLLAAEQNLAHILTEINRAQKTGGDLNNGMLNMNEFSKKSLARLWGVTHFYCDDEEVVERCWIFKDGSMMVNNIPLIITPNGDEQFGFGTYQEAVVEFDRNGQVTDFRFSLSSQTGLSMTNCGTEDIENSHVIQQQVERFRTAYNTKDLATIEQMFSDDALIITGSVVKTKTLSDSEKATFKVVYNRQNKDQYINNLRKCFARNKWIDVKFSEIENSKDQGACAGITRSRINPNKYAVRLRQSWKSSNYEDEGYLFLLFDFTPGKDPEINVRTWQPEWTDIKRKDGHQQPDDDISTLGGFGF